MRPDPSDIAARRLRSVSNRRGFNSQPLKPKSNKQFGLVVMGLAFLGSLVLLAQNYKQIGQYMNRPITKVRMDNQWQHVSEAEVGSLITNFMGAGFFNFDVAGVKSTLEAHAWVEEASIKRLWPDMLTLQLTEHVAIARWGEGELLNQHGEIFVPVDIGEMNALPILSGPINSQIKVMEQYQLMSQLLYSSGLKLNGLTLSMRGSWELTLNESIQVAVGRIEVVERFQRFINFYEGQLVSQTANISSVDLRYDNGIAIRNSSDELAEVAIR